TQIRFAEKNIELADWIHGNGFSVPFFVFKQVAKSYRTEELLGLLSTKYIYSKKALENEKLKLIKQDPKNSDYLYENLAYLPRYRNVESAILIYSEDKNNMQITYSLLAHSKFNLSSTIVVSLASIEDENLEKYDAIIVGKRLSQEEINILSDYSKKGGIVFPDIFNKNLTIEEIFSKFDKQFFEISFKRGRDKLELDAKRGWIVLSDTFSIYSGWEAKQDKDKLKIYRTNGVISSVYSPKEEKIVFEYRPKEFYFGELISMVSLIIACSIFYLKRN
ncbi:MAG: hypothetical protein QW331_03105, partial [Candidatus Woesearchaeota archaeon]